MFSSNSLSNVNVIRPLPRFYTLRFGRHRTICDDEQEEKLPEYKIKEINRPTAIDINNDESPSILITGIRDRDWRFFDDPRPIDPMTIPKIEYRLIPSVNNTMKYRSTDFQIEGNESQYEEYDLDEQDMHWLVAYNQFRHEKHLPELDENIFEYIMQLFEQQCLLAIRQKNYEDTIECDACHRIDDVDDLIQCIQCQTIVHKKCYGVENQSNQWRCFSCNDDQQIHRCCMCEKTGGALKVFQSPSDEFQAKRWIHLSCAFWFPQFEFDEKMTPILKENLVNHDNERCSICKQSTGFKLNCSWQKCQERFHVQCAIDNQYDMFIAENEDNSSIHLLALCHRHAEKIDVSEKRILEIKQKRFEQFASYINLNAIQTETFILPDVLQSIHTYWLLKRQANHGRPLIDLPEEIFSHNYDRTVNLIEYARRYHMENDDRMNDFLDDKSNVLQFLSTNRISTQSSKDCVFVKYARHDRKSFLNYERNQFCLLDIDKTKRS